MLFSMALVVPMLMAAAEPTPADPPAAATPAAAPAATKAKDSDPLVCERFAETGSLLKSKKVCMRKSEWDAQRQENRQLIDRSQTQMPMNSGG